MLKNLFLCENLLDPALSVPASHICTNLFSKLAGLLYRSSIKPVKLQEGTTTSQVGWPWSGPHTTKAASAPTRAASMSGMQCRTWSPPAPTLQPCLLTSQFWILLEKVGLAHKRNLPFSLFFLQWFISFLFINVLKCFSLVILIKMAFNISLYHRSSVQYELHRTFTASLETSSPFLFQANWKRTNRTAH